VGFGRLHKNSTRPGSGARGVTMFFRLLQPPPQLYQRRVGTRLRQHEPGEQRRLRSNPAHRSDNENQRAAVQGQEGVPVDTESTV
jgi:hypothetical protein